MSLESFIGQFGHAGPDHPLNALRRVGTVSDLGHTPRTLGVLLDGDTDQVDTLYLPYLDSYHEPQVGDVVIVLSVPPDNVVLGSITQLQSPVGHYFYEERYLESLIVQPATITQLQGFQTTMLGTANGSGFDGNGNWACPFDGIWTMTLSVGLVGWTPGARMAVFISRGTNNVTDATSRLAGNDANPGSTTPVLTVAATKFLPGDANLCFSLVQNDATQRTTTQDQRSYVSLSGRAVDRTKFTNLP